MNQPLPLPGLHYGVPFEVYQSWPAANFSKIKPILESASKCKWEMDNPNKPTVAMILGSALHIAVLEPGRFETTFHICPPADGRTTEGKNIIAAHKQIAGDKVMIRQGLVEDEGNLGQVQNLRGMASSVHASKSASMFADAACGHNEVSALWKDTETGLFCKARYDRYVPDLNQNGPVIVELKTSRDARQWAFEKDVDSRHYDAQSAGYRFGHHCITGQTAKHVIIAVENHPPFDLAVYILGDTTQQTGLRKYRAMLTRFAECSSKNEWPGYPDTITVIETPEYSHKREYAD